MTIKECKVETVKRNPEKTLDTAERLKGTQVTSQSLDEETALKEARRCLGNNRCESCDLCQLLCPDLAISRNEATRELQVDLNFCKGCGICALVCPKGVIKMVPEVDS